jgi:hypothetical protein
MNRIAKVALGALMLGGAAVATTTAAEAGVSVGIGIGAPGYYHGPYYGPYHSCSYYRYWRLPAPSRCYRDYYDYYGPSVFIDSGFVFRDRDDFARFRDRDDFRGGFRGGFHDHDGDGRHR